MPHNAERPSLLKALFSRIQKQGIWPAVPILWQFMDQIEKSPGCKQYEPTEAVAETKDKSRRLSGATTTNN
jgi:hypothetical protein